MANRITLSGTLGQIQPLAMPSASALDFAGGDVEHLSPDRGLDYVTISTSTRELAHRDNLMAEKVNELITVVNNKEQIITLPLVRTTLVPGEVLAASNYRIPNGYEGRVLSATVSSSPTAAVLLEVLYNANAFGLSDGDSIVSTYSEATASTSFQGTGEFIVRLTNVTASPADISASVFFTLRPAVDQAGGVIGPGVQGEKGDPGPQGDKGDKGYTGSPGRAGQAGLVWRGTYNNATAYNINDAVNYTFGGTIGVASFINVVPCTGVTPPLPSLAPSTNWNLLASGNLSGIIPWSNISSTPTTSAGYGVTGGAQLDSLAGVAANGMLARSAANTITPRTVVGSSNVTVANGDGSAGNPTISLPAILAGLTVYNGSFTGTTYVQGSFTTMGQVKHATRIITGAGTVAATDEYMILSGTPPYTVMMTDASANFGRTLTAKSKANGSVTFDATNHGGIDTVYNYLALTLRQTAKFHSDGTTWNLIGPIS